MKRIILVLIFISFVSCSDEPSGKIRLDCNVDNVEEKGNRKLGIDILDIAQNESFDDNINLFNEIGADFTTVHINWNDIEPQPGQYTDPFDIFVSFSQLLPANDMKLSLTIRPIDATGKFVPDDLMNLRFNDSLMISRFIKMIDFVFENIDPDLLQNIVIGNEIDLYNKENEPGTFWSDYSSFLLAVNNHLDEYYPGLQMGFTVTADDAVDGRFNTRRLLDSSDFLGVTYYGLGENFTVKNNVDWLIDITDIINVWQGYAISFQELGLPTSSSNRSDELAQAEFFCSFFGLWDINTEQVVSCNIVRLNDYSQEHAVEMAGPYGLDSEEFIEYLRSLGLRTFAGEKKVAYDLLKEQTQARGW